MSKIYRLAGLLTVSLVFAFSALAQAPHSVSISRHELRRGSDSPPRRPEHYGDRESGFRGRAGVEDGSRRTASGLAGNRDRYEPNGQAARHSDATANSPLLITIALPDTATPGKKVTLTVRLCRADFERRRQPHERRALRFYGQDVGVSFAAVAMVSADELSFEPLHRNVQGDCAGDFCGDGHRQSRCAGDEPAARARRPERNPYIFHATTPGPSRIVCRGNAAAFTGADGGLNTISVYTPPAQATTATSYGTSLSHIISYFSETFGALEAEPSLTIAQMPDGSVSGYSAPGLLLVSARQWTTKSNERLLSQLAAGQWWGDRVLPATIADTWITDGLSRYSEAMYAEQSDGVAGLHKALEDFAVGALMYEDTTPISQASQAGDIFESVSLGCLR